MARRTRPDLPPVIPPHFTQEQSLAALQTRVAWTYCQARVVLAGIPGRTNKEIAGQLGMAERTVHSHYNDAMVWVGCSRRGGVTAVAVAALWQSAQAGLPL